MSEELLRPSALPKLAECRCFVSAPGTSEAAARGTRLDEVIRAAWNGDDRAWDKCESPEEAEAVNFAISTLKLLACGMQVETSEEQLRAVVPIPGVRPGTMDALCAEGGWLADFKTGQVRSYYAQMAAYALACMDAYFSDEWTAHLIFVDQKQVVSHKFTRADAEDCVRDIVTAPTVATPCDYCGWCGAFETCPALSRAAADVVQDELPALTAAKKSRGELPPSMELLLSDHAKAHEFMARLKIVNDWADMLKKRLLDQLAAEGTTSEYFTRVVVSGSKKVNPLSLGRYMSELGFDRVLKCCSQIPLSKLEEVWHEVFGDKPVPEDIIVTSGGSVSLRPKKIKK